MMRVICVKWGSKYGREWVYALKRMVNRHFGSCMFVCMTDEPIHGVECVPCEPDLPTWWSKVGLFKPGKFPGDNLYLDLDVVITRGIGYLVDLLASDRGKLWTLDDFSYSLAEPKNHVDPQTRKLLGGAGTVNSSVMLWHGDTARAVWDDFDPAVMNELHGDQNWITRALWPDTIELLPERVASSYKYHDLHGDRFGRRDSDIVVFHGEPKVTDLPKQHRLRKEWESLSMPSQPSPGTAPSRKKCAMASARLG